MPGFRPAAGSCTALQRLPTITELLESGRDSNDPVMTVLRQELLTGLLIRFTITLAVARVQGSTGPDWPGSQSSG